MAKKNLNGIRVGSMVRGNLGDKKNTMVEGKVLKLNAKGKAVVQHEERGKLILPVKVLKRIDPKKKKTTKKKKKASK
jgi:hypothetical protein